MGHPIPQITYNRMNVGRRPTRERIAILAVLAVATSCGCVGVGRPSLELEPVGRQVIPTFEVDGVPARIHTQGLYVTPRHYIITGRLETSPRRALLIRVDRQDPRHVETLDITPSPLGGRRLDHPGGFDSDGQALWIPVAESRRGGGSVILRVPLRPDDPLNAVTPEVAFTVNDHIGAIAVDPEAERLYGANWDTELVYVWAFDGRLIERIPRAELVSDDPSWGLAVQDWKCVGPGRVLAGGIDKSPGRDPFTSPAVVAWLDLRQRRCLASVRLPRPVSLDMPITNEGLDFVKDQLYLLPGDLGEGAEVFQYRVVQPESMRRPGGTDR